jgi:hypothetical protein
MKHASNSSRDQAEKRRAVTVENEGWRWGPNHYDCAAALPAGVIESQPRVWPNWATASHPRCLGVLNRGTLIDRGNPVAPESRVSQVAADMGLSQGEIPASLFA